jgi:CubicO group peptidase (beta-lactamase class C family)
MKKHLLAAGILLTHLAMAQHPISIGEEEIKTLKKLAAEKKFSGALMVVQNDKTVFTLHEGSTNAGNSKPLNADVRMNTCSNGKSMTAVLIQQLIAAGKLHPDQTIAQLLPAEKQLPNAEKITVQHLLTHTSGLGDFFEHPDFEEKNPRTTEEFMQLIRTMKPVHDSPGTKFSYSNAGYIVLGKILEAKYNQSYQQIVKQRILQPSGIDTAIAGHSYATGYYQSKGKWVVGEGNDPQIWSAAGGIFLSVNEWHQFTTALAKGKLVDTAQLQQLWTRYSRPEQDPEFVGYGRGFMIESPAGLTFIGHNGGTKGFQSAYRYVPQANMYLYVFSNHDGGAEELFMDMLMGLVKQYQSSAKN